jgi:hypothetical protein
MVKGYNQPSEIIVRGMNFNRLRQEQVLMQFHKIILNKFLISSKVLKLIMEAEQVQAHILIKEMV